MTTRTTADDVIKAAASIARDAAEGRLSPSDLERQAVAELTELAGTVTGPESPLWPVQVEIARGVLAAGGIGADELLEWAAVARSGASGGEATAADESPVQP